eukprot:scaffold668_cov385-Prasinococcus_capsulatus_cf.AAC.10
MPDGAGPTSALSERATGRAHTSARARRRRRLAVDAGARSIVLRIGSAERRQLPRRPSPRKPRAHAPPFVAKWSGSAQAPHAGRSVREGLVVGPPAQELRCRARGQPRSACVGQMSSQT